MMPPFIWIGDGCDWIGCFGLVDFWNAVFCLICFFSFSLPCYFYLLVGVAKGLMMWLDIGVYLSRMDCNA
jgi:hypothetical protein